jgi:outer membrane protein OmpA-like peptidoglycan-associated protein
VSLALSTKGQVMISSLQRLHSHGEKDLYVSFKIEDNLWSEPLNLGPVLNSADAETTPFLSQDNRRLYFASDRPGGVGGLDIYVSERLDYTWLKWTEPKPLRAPINSKWDDSQPFLDDVNNNFYFASRRDGSGDIFRLPLKPKPKLKAPIQINGLIVDGVTLRPIRAELLYGPVDTKGYLEYYHTYTGEFKFPLTEYGAYKFLAHKPGYGDARLMFDTRLAEEANLPEHDLILYMYRDSTSSVIDPLPLVITPSGPDAAAKNDIDSAVAIETPKIGDKLTFYHIYFEQSKPVILNTSERALNEIYRILTAHKDIHIRIEGHTDNVGNEMDLMELSWQRAQAIKEYLAANGIDPLRVSTIGYGATKPLASNLTEEGREKNRRVEVQIVE